MIEAGQLAAVQPALTLPAGCQLRLATLADLETLLQLERYCFSPWLAFGRACWRRRLHQPQAVWLVEHEAQVVAWLDLQPYTRWRQLVIRVLAVHWHWRRQGLGRQLLCWAEYRARQLGLTRLRLDVDCTNSAALALYRYAGFVRVRELPDYYGIGRSGWRLMRELSSLPAEESEQACFPSSPTTGAY